MEGSDRDVLRAACALEGGWRSVYCAHELGVGNIITLTL